MSRLVTVLFLLSTLGAFACGDDPPIQALACEQNRDCPAGQVCGCDSFCFTPSQCRTDSQCCSDESCIDGLCLPMFECEGDDDCNNGEVCNSCACFPRSCSGDGDCADDELCEGGICLDADLPPCGGCTSTLVCDPLSGLCLIPPTSCQDQSCQSGEILVINGVEEHLGPVCDGRATCSCTRPRGIPPGRIGAEFDALHVFATEFVVAAHDHLYGDLVILEFADDPEDALVTYVDGVPDDLAAADPTGPRDGIIEHGEDVGSDPSMAWLTGPATGELAVIYRDDSAGRLRFAFRDATGLWEASTVEGTLTVGDQNSLLALDDRRWVAIYPVSAADFTGLRVAISDDEAPFGPADWQLSTVLSEPTNEAETATGLAPSAVRLGANIYIAFHNAVAGNLELVWGPPDGSFDHHVLYEGTSTSGIEGSGDVGMYLDLQVTPTGRLGLVFLDAISGELLYGEATVLPDAETAIAWELEPEVVDPGRRMSPPTIIGGGVTITYTETGTPMIAYQDSTQGDLIVATPGPAEDWERSAVSREGVSGFSPHLFPNLNNATWVLQGSVIDQGDGELVERLDARPTPF